MCVCHNGGGGVEGGSNGGGGGGSVVRGNACSDDSPVHTIKLILLFDGKSVHQSK